MRRRGRFGYWEPARGADGAEQSVLRIRPELTADPDVARLVVSAVRAVRAAAVPGVLPILDVGGGPGTVWLRIAGPAGPTLDEVLAASRGVPADLVLEVGRTLVDLHALGVAHGALGADTVLVPSEGRPLLAEVGVAPVLYQVGEADARHADRQAWADLARLVAAGAEPSHAGRLRAAAHTAVANNLVAAVRELGAPPAATPGTSHGRAGGTAPRRGDAPADEVGDGTADASAGIPPRTGADGSPRPRGTAQPTTAPSADDEANRSPGPADQRTTRPRGTPQPTTAPPADHEADRSPGPAGPADQRTTRLRAPLPAADPPKPTWDSRARPAARRGRRRHGGLFATLALAAGVVVYLLWPQGEPLQVSAAAVTPAEDPGNACAVTVDVVGTITTNGRPGTVRYQWLRSDGATTSELAETVADGATTVQVHLLWTVSGSGTYPATATLRVLAPNPVDAVGGFTYSCP